ncbi:S8 family peptidase [Streptomyces xiamenensis]
MSEEHADLAGGKVTAAEDFSGSPDILDRQGHGTHVASTAAGTGVHGDGTYTGIAPGARILNGKVLDDEGGGWEPDIIEGMEWAVDQGAGIISMSLGIFPHPVIDPMEEAVNRLSAASDALFVVAARQQRSVRRQCSEPRYGGGRPHRWSGRQGGRAGALLLCRPEKRMPFDELARISTELGSPVPGDAGSLFTIPDSPSWGAGAWGELPRTTTVFVQDNTSWMQTVVTDSRADYWTGFQPFEGGENHNRTFNTGVFGPQISDDHYGLFREGNTLHRHLGSFSDGAGHHGGSDYDADTARTVLYRHGEEFATGHDILSTVSFALPPSRPGTNG